MSLNLMNIKTIALKGVVAAVATIGITSVALAQSITGAGASFPAPVYAQWADAYHKATGIRVNYQSIGSGAGINQIKARTVDFGASDAPLSDAELKELGLIQFPTVIGGVVPVVNIQGIKPGELKLSGEVIANIYLGKITHWNDAAITALNPKLKLPNSAISVAHRSDGSGTSFAFTDYLSQVSPEWKERVGAGTAVNWPVGAGGKGNEGVSAFVMRLPNSIGYVEYAYAKQSGMSYAQLQNRTGSYVSPSNTAFQAAAAGIDWSKSFSQSLINAEGDKAWPISTATFILIYQRADKSAQTQEVLKFFNWIYTHGDDAAQKLDYVPFPQEVKELIRKQWGGVVNAQGQAISYR